jgi:copper(I)-binding protein
MHKSAMIMAATALAGAGALTGCGAPAPQRALGVDQAWVRLPAVDGRPGAAYFTIRGGPRPVTLTAVSSSAASRVELHASMEHGGVMTMKPLTGVAVPAGADMAFAPGANHAMLYDIDPATRPGGTIPLSFAFADGSAVTLNARVIAAGDSAPSF